MAGLQEKRYKIHKCKKRIGTNFVDEKCLFLQLVLFLLPCAAAL